MRLVLIDAEPECQSASAELWAGAKISARQVFRRWARRVAVSYR